MKKILIIEDNRLLTSYLEKKLREAGHEVHIALTGMSAISLLSDCSPDFVFIDYFLPNMNGDKLCQIIRNMKHLENAYLVIMSAAATELNLDLSTMGANAIIAKGTFQEIHKYINSVIADAEIPGSDKQKYEKLGFDGVNSRQLTMELLTKYRHIQAILDSISEGIIEIYSGQIVYANPTALTILGKSLDELLTAYLPSLFDESERPKVESVIKSDGNSNSTVDWKKPIKLGDRILFLRKLPFQGDTETIIILITDITERVCAEDALREERNSLGKKVHEKTVYLLQEIDERKRIEKALRKSETGLRQTQAAAHIGSWIWHIKTNRLEWSDEMHRIFGIDKASFSGDLAEIISCAIHPDDRYIIEQANLSAIRDGKLSQTEYRVVWPDKSEHVIWAEAGEWIMDPSGNRIALSGYAQDITDRKRVEEEKRSLEERLQRSEKLESIGKLAGGVAHDLNNVLGVVSGYSELLMERIPAGDPLREYAANILKSSEKAASIIQDLLTLARRGVVVSEVIDLNHVVSDLLATPEFDALLAYHPNVILKTDLEKDLLNIKGSPVHLEKTVMNLASNAAEAIIGSGEVNIRTENRYLDRAVRGYDRVDEGDYVVLTVSDNGRGIPAADFYKIFEPFYTKKSMGRSGTGLGLAIVWGTVKDHKGYIDVQSVEGKGTTFTLYFPVTREKTDHLAQKIPLEQYMGHGESVLVVDDVDGQRQVATALITQIGYQVNAVASGAEAVEYLKSNKADILILDMIMEPGIDGLETYQQIVSFKPKQKVIIVSGFSETDRVNMAKQLGVGAYVKKPYVMEKIGVAIRDELAKNKWRQIQQ